MKLHSISERGQSAGEAVHRSRCSHNSNPIAQQPNPGTSVDGGTPSLLLGNRSFLNIYKGAALALCLYKVIVQRNKPIKWTDTPTIKLGVIINNYLPINYITGTSVHRQCFRGGSALGHRHSPHQHPPLAVCIITSQRTGVFLIVRQASAQRVRLCTDWQSASAPRRRLPSRVCVLLLAEWLSSRPPWVWHANTGSRPKHESTSHGCSGAQSVLVNKIIATNVLFRH